MGVDYLSFSYAATVALGGAVGYIKSGSIPSLTAGLIFGGLLGYGAYQTSVNPDNYTLSLGASLVLGGIMGARFYHSGKLIPAGLIATMSALMVCRFAARGLGLTSTSTMKDVTSEN